MTSESYRFVPRAASYRSELACMRTAVCLPWGGAHAPPTRLAPYLAPACPPRLRILPRVLEAADEWSRPSQTRLLNAFLLV